MSPASPKSCQRKRDGLHVGDRLDLVGEAGRSMKTEGRTPIMHDQSDVFRDPQGVEPRVQIARMVDKAVSLRRRFSGLAHSDQVGRQAATVFAEIGDDVPPEVGRGRITMKEHDRIALADVDEAHLGIEHAATSPWVRIGGADLEIRNLWVGH